MIAVIPVGRNRPATLPYVLRALETHAALTEVVTVGETPEGVAPDLHIASPNDSQPHRNVLGHLRGALCHIEAASFIWCDDDTFPVAPWIPAVYVRKYSIAQHLRHFPNRGSYSKAVGASVAVMRSWGLDPEEVPCGPTHRPWLVDAERARMVVEALEEAGGGSFRTLYVAGLGGVVPANDPKIAGRGVPKPDADVISVTKESWRRNAGRMVRERFGDYSAWETVSGVSASPRGAQRAP